MILNKNYFETNTIKAIYIIEKTTNTIAEYINIYQVKNSIYFTTKKIIINVLRDIYQDSDCICNAQQKYISFKQKLYQDFVFFCSTFIYLNYILNYNKTMLVQDLKTKNNKNLQNILTNNLREFDILA